ncbi:MAG: hypothetical protein JXR07_03705 [Reichenbachiella sp.]
MPIKPAVENVLGQLQWLLENVSNDEYSQIIANLNGSSIGQHVRHTLEFFKCLFDGIESGIVNYDERPRDLFLENNTLEATSMIESLRGHLEKIPDDKSLSMIQSYDQFGDENLKIESNIKRELVYNIEHAVHHLALIRVALKEIKPSLEIEDAFGLASSTLRYRKSVVTQKTLT